MGLRMVEIGLAVVLMGMLTGGVSGQSSCNTMLMGMASCLNYITGISSTPSSPCCSQLAGIAQSQPRCLCSVLKYGGGSTLGITVNQTLALGLPGACYVQTPPVSQCDAAGGAEISATSPESSPPHSSSDETPAEVPTTQSESGIPSGGGSKTVPSTDGGIMDSPLHVVVLLLITACVSTFIA